jgi:endo-1,4-beta-xylanase
MMLKKSKIELFIFIVLWTFCGATSCNKNDSNTYQNELRKKIDEYNRSDKGLKDYYTPGDYFYMGVAISPSFIDYPRKADLIKRHFNSVTCDNDMKWSSLQPTEGVFNFTNADKIVAFAQANGMKVRGHCLCWHNQVPAWIFRDGDADASKELVLQRLRTHITTVVNHFKGKVYAWDVVNEAIDDGSSVYRASKWYTICGEDYITEAFKAARAADPDAILFYNDYTAIDPTKRDKIYDLLVNLKAQNLVDGMGLQGHWNISYPSNSLINDALNKYKSLELQIQITEMDVSVYTSNSDHESAYTDALAQQQTIAFGKFFQAFRDFKDAITGITFWGVADDNTWLDNFPVAGRKNYPLLFDKNLDPKPAYFEVIDF